MFPLRTAFTALGVVLFCGCMPPTTAPADSAMNVDAQSEATVDASAEASAADAASAASVAATEAVLDRVVGPLFDANALMDLNRCVGGMAVAVTPAGDVLRGYGATQAGGTQRPTETSLFQVGSISKVLTGLALARLVVDGTWAETDRVTARLSPELARPLGAASVTLAELVSHRAGFNTMPFNTADRDGNGMRDPGIDPLAPVDGYTRTHLVAALAMEMPMSAPYRYSNLGIGLLGLAIQDHLRADSNHAVLRRMVGEPLGFTSTYGEARAVDPAAAMRVVQGYASAGRARVVGKLAGIGVLASAGEVVTSGGDMRRFLRVLTGLDTTPISPAIDRMLVPLGAALRPGYEIGYALEMQNRPDGIVYSKGGDVPSYLTFLTFRRTPRVGLIIMSACGDFDPIVTVGARALDELTALHR